MIENVPFLTNEQRVSRLFEVNALHHLEQELLLALKPEETDAAIAASALMHIRHWADKEYAAIERKYRTMAIENMARRKVTSWVK